MNKARELLKRALDELVSQDMDLRSEFETSRGWESPNIIQEISEYLASEGPEKREPLSDEEIYREMSMNCSGRYYDAFCDGVRFAEKHHGIKEEEMCEESKRVWVARDKYVVDPDTSCERTVEYIRADIVDELVTALKTAHCWTSKKIHEQHTAPLIEGALGALSKLEDDLEDKND